MSADKTPTAEQQPTTDTSLRNFVVGLLAVSAVIVVIAFLLEASAG